MQTFLLPYGLSNEPQARYFAKVQGADIVEAAAKAEKQIREFQHGKGNFCSVMVAEQDWTHKDRDTGQDLPPAEAQNRGHRRRWRRNQGGVYQQAA